MTTSIQIGKYLAVLREKADIKQNELAQRLTWAASGLSRIENGERAIAPDELEALLQAIGTDEALRFAETYDRLWVNLSEPPLGHPDGEILWEAEQAVRNIASLLDNRDLNHVFANRLEEYKSALKNAASLVLGTEYKVAFVGDRGVGKSTAICRAADLEVQEGTKMEPVLESGGGGVTICEVHLTQGPDYGILVEPVSDSELRREVGEFAHYLMQTLQPGDERDAGDQETHRISEEIRRAIRNMSSLTSVRKTRQDGSRYAEDQARNLAEEFLNQNRDADALSIEILTRINLQQRTRRELWYPETSRKLPKQWLKDIFVEVNNGRNPEFSLPERIEIIVPDPILREESLSIRLIDTRGIDVTAEREDLESHFNEAKSIVVLCSKFNDAPSHSVQQLLERSVQGQFPDLNTKAAVLVLPRPEEALAVKNDVGELAEDTEDGYDLKGEQAKATLDTQNLPIADIEFFNVREDEVRRLNDFLLRLVGNLRELHLQRLNAVIYEANAVVQNFEKEQTSVTLKEVARRLKVWLENHEDLSHSTLPLEARLFNAINNAHSSSVRASIRREGEWYNLDYSHQLGYGARVKASNTIRTEQRDFTANIRNILDDLELEEAYGLAQQAQRIFNSGIETLLRSSRQVGVNVHVNSMKPDSVFWSQCEDRWGQGPGYRDDILSFHRKWFETRNQRNENRVQSIVEREWQGTLSRLSGILQVD